MFATLMVNLTALVVLALIVAGTMWAWRHANRNPFFLPMGRRGRGVGRLRVACGVLGGLILVVVSLATWQTVHATYTNAQAQINPTIHAPAMPPPALPAVSSPLPQSLDKARLLVTVTVLDARVPGYAPVAATQTELEWPARKKCTLPLEFLGLQCKYELEVMGVQLGKPLPRPGRSRTSESETPSEPGPEPAAEPSGQPQLQVVRAEILTCQVRGQAYEVASAAGPAVEGRQMLTPGPGFTGETGWRDNPLSITRALPQHYFVTSVFTVLQSGDPLRSVPLLDFLPPLSEPSQHWRQVWSHPTQLYGVRDRYLSAGGLGLMEHLGLPALLLIAATVLLAQVFRRRDLAIAGLLLGMVLFVAGWDRAMLAYDLSRFNDEAAPLGVRLAGCSRAAQTFFYGRTAKDALMQAKDDATDAMRACAGMGTMVLDNVLH